MKRPELKIQDIDGMEYNAPPVTLGLLAALEKKTGKPFSQLSTYSMEDWIVLGAAWLKLSEQTIADKFESFVLVKAFTTRLQEAQATQT